MACNSCNDHIFKIIPNTKTKLGKCVLCMFLSFFGTLTFWGFYFFLKNENGSVAILFVAALFSLILFSHIVAFIVNKFKG